MLQIQSNKAGALGSSANRFSREISSSVLEHPRRASIKRSSVRTSRNCPVTAMADLRSRSCHGIRQCHLSSLMLRKQILPLRAEALLGNKVMACGSLFCLMSFVLGRNYSFYCKNLIVGMISIALEIR